MEIVSYKVNSEKDKKKEERGVNHNNIQHVKYYMIRKNKL